MYGEECYTMWRPFVPPSARRGIFAAKDGSPCTPLDKRKDVDAWVRRHFRPFRLPGPKKILPTWVYSCLVKLYGKAIKQGHIANLEEELDESIRGFIEQVVRIGMKEHTFTLSYNRSDNVILLVANHDKTLYRDWSSLQETLQLHGFNAIIYKFTKPSDEGKVAFLLDLTTLQPDVTSVAVWVLLHEYRQTPITWNGDVWIPREVPKDANAAAQHLL